MTTPKSPLSRRLAFAVAALAPLAAAPPADAKTIDVPVSDPRGTVTFNCDYLLGPQKMLTGAFVSALDVTTDAQIAQLKKSGMYTQWVKSRADKSTPRSGMSMLIHLAEQHKPPHQYCVAQVRMIRGVDKTLQKIPGDSCPVVQARAACLSPQ